MNNDTFAIRLHEARLQMNLSMDKLVERTGEIITKQSVSRYEKGIMHPKQDAMAALAKALCISQDYFYGTGPQIDIPMLRTTSDGCLTEAELQALDARLSFWTEQYLSVEKETNSALDFANPMSDIAVCTMTEASQAADLLRERWHCGDGPIVSILRLLERKGIKIMSTELPADVYGLSTWADGRQPLMVLDCRPEKTTVERLRFTAGHELAHLLLTFPDDSEFGVEKRCNKFASFFLFPQRTFVEEMGGEKRATLRLEEMIDLRNLYGVSIAAQVHEAWDIGMISREHYDWWYDEVIKKNPKEAGWGGYMLPETLGREKRVRALVNENNNK